MQAGRRLGGQTTLSRYGREHLAGLLAVARASKQPVVRTVQPEIKIRVREDQDKALRAVAASYGVSMSHVMRDALDLWLSEWEEAKAEAAAHRVMGEFHERSK